MESLISYKGELNYHVIFSMVFPEISILLTNCCMCPIVGETSWYLTYTTESCRTNWYNKLRHTHCRSFSVRSWYTPFLYIYIYIYMYISIANVCLTCSMYNHLITNKKTAPAFREAAPPFCLFESGQVSAVFVWFWSSGESSVWHCKICIKSTSTEPQQRQWIPPRVLDYWEVR